MADQDTLRPSSPTLATARRPWIAPRVEELPRLTELTLASALDPIDGNCPIGGSTCF